MSGPDPGSFGAVDVGSVPSVSAFDGADPAFDSGPPLDGSAERSSVFLGLSGLAGSALAGDHHVPHTQVVEGVVDLLFPVSAIGGDRAGWPAGAPGDPFDGGGELGRVGRVALLDGLSEQGVEISYSYFDLK